MGPFRSILNAVIGWGLLWGPLSLPAHAEAPSWTRQAPVATPETLWVVGRAMDQADLTDGRARAVDHAQDDLMTRIGIHGASATWQSARGVGEAFSQFSELAEISLRPAQYYVQRHATQEGTRWNVWVLCAVDQARFTQLQEQWRITVKPHIDAEQLAQKACFKADLSDQLNAERFCYEGMQGHRCSLTREELQQLQAEDQMANTRLFVGFPVLIGGLALLGALIGPRRQ